MIAALVLWSHALAALAFGAAALAAWSRREGRARAAFAAVLIVSAWWAVAVAGTTPGDLGARAAQAGRDLAWLGFALALVRRARTAGLALSAVYAAVGAVVAIALGLAVAEAAVATARARADFAAARLSFEMLAAAGALVLVLHLHHAATGAERVGVRLIAIALAAMWGGDLVLAGLAYATHIEPATLSAVRGVDALIAALLLAAAAQRRDSWSIAVSRPVALQALGAAALLGYAGVVAVLAGVAAHWGGEHARALEVGVVIGAAVALGTVLSTGWWRAWAKVIVAKHLFEHRYDYRTEWLRFTGRLAGDGAPLEVRVAQAVAELLDAPAAVLLDADGTHAAWRWDGDVPPLDTPLADHLARTGRIVELDAVRADPAVEGGTVPAAMIAGHGWALVPLLHAETMVGAVLLARPPVARALDWEDFDLLRVAGRQAASYLAEDRAGRALAEAQRFDEFHRRFAFILHDIKNLVSQQQLVARNAERHGDDPAFRADMIATLKDSAERMTVLIARLSQAEPSPNEPFGVIDLAALARRVAAQRRAQHPVMIQAEAPCWASGHAQRLEQVVSHLVQNAIEASTPGSPVTVAALAVDGRAVLEVTDLGMGMSPAFVRDALFRPFVSTKPGGFGIGAYEARQLVAAMGGELSVESAEGVGTRFRIALPSAPAMEQAA